MNNNYGLINELKRIYTEPYPGNAFTGGIIMLMAAPILPVVGAIIGINKLHKYIKNKKQENLKKTPDNKVITEKITPEVLEKTYSEIINNKKDYSYKYNPNNNQEDYYTYDYIKEESKTRSLKK